MKKVICFVLLLLPCVAASAQQQGIGIRLGQPMGITYKKYLPHNKALEFMLATAPRDWGYNYYKNSFGWYDKYNDYLYRSHEVDNILYLGARYLFHYDIVEEGMSGDLKWFWGLGGVLKTASVEYDYIDEAPPHNWHSDTRTDIDLGPEGVIGMEYTFEKVPVSLFADFSLMMELVDRPTLRTLGGTGARFNF